MVSSPHYNNVCFKGLLHDLYDTVMMFLGCFLFLSFFFFMAQSHLLPLYRKEQPGHFARHFNLCSTDFFLFLGEALISYKHYNIHVNKSGVCKNL